MTHYASSRFWRCYRALPKNVRELADRSYALLESDPNHRSLRFKKVGSYWSARVGLHYRALAVEAPPDLVWFWIGSHADYDKLVGRHPSVTAARPKSIKTEPPSRRPRRPSAARPK